MRFKADNEAGATIHEAVYYSVGGGFVVDGAGKAMQARELRCPLPYPYQSAADLL